MKKKIAILGSTGSIGNTTLGIIKKDKKTLILFYCQQIVVPQKFLSNQKNLT